MAVNKNVQDFFELRLGFQGMADFAEAAIAFMDEQGIAMMRGRSYGKRAAAESTNGNGNGHAASIEKLRASAKARFAARSKGGKANRGRHNSTKDIVAADADGKHVTAQEAAKMLKCSDANVRLMWTQGRLPKPTYEKRPWSKKYPDRVKKVQVIPVAAVKDFAAAQKNTE